MIDKIKKIKYWYDMFMFFRRLMKNDKFDQFVETYSDLASIKNQITFDIEYSDGSIDTNIYDLTETIHRKKDNGTK